MATVIQTTILSPISFFHIKPELFLILSVYFGLSFGRITGTAAGVFTGILQDIISGGFLGTNSLSKGFGSFICSIVSDRLAGGNVISQFFLIFGFTLVDGLFSQLIGLAAFRNNVPFHYFIPGLLWLGLFNAVVGCFLVHFLNRLEGCLMGKISKEQGNKPKRNRYGVWA